MGSVKLAVDESKRSVKPMSRQLIEGNLYSSDKSKKVARSVHLMLMAAKAESPVKHEPYSAS